MRPPRLDQLDELDRNLVALLQENARESVANLARQLGVARTTVIARIERLERSGVIAGYGVRLGQDVLDASIYAYVGIILAPKFGPAVQKRLVKMPEVQLLCAVSGEFDYVAWRILPTGSMTCSIRSAASKASSGRRRRSSSRARSIGGRWARTSHRATRSHCAVALPGTHRVPSRASASSAVAIAT